MKCEHETKDFVINFVIVNLELYSALSESLSFPLLYSCFLQVLIRANLIQREADNIGPYAELVSWKQRSAKFNYLLEQMKGNRCKNACGILKLHKSKILEVSARE